MVAKEEQLEQLKVSGYMRDFIIDRKGLRRPGMKRSRCSRRHPDLIRRQNRLTRS